MAFSFQIDVRKYAEMGENKTLLIRERDKGGRIVGCELASFSRLPGLPDIFSSGSGNIHEMPIPEAAFEALVPLKIFPVLDYQPAADPIPVVTTLDQNDPWNYMMQIANIGIARFLPRAQVVNIARNYGYTGN